MSQTTLRPDRTHLEQFLTTMYKDADPESYVSFRAFRDNGRSEKPLFTESVKAGSPGLLDAAFAFAQRAANSNDPVVYAPPVATFTHDWRAREIDLANGLALSVECDAWPRRALKTLSEHLGRPTFVVESGGLWLNPDTGALDPKLHIHYRLSRPTREAREHVDLRTLRKLACYLVGADTTNISIVHPIRGPGSLHRKSAPRLTRIVQADATATIDLAEALRKLRAIAPAEFVRQPNLAAAKPNPNKTADPKRVAAALAAIPNDDKTSWDDWNKVGMAAWTATEGDPHGGFEPFDTWSEKSGKYDAAATEARWQHYSSSPPDKLGAGTLFWLADKFSPGWSAELDKIDVEKWFDQATADAATAEPMFPFVDEGGDAASPSATPLLKTLAAFVSEYTPLDYAIEPIVRTGSLYTLTAKTGAGKTAWLISTALALVSGRRDILNLEVEPGRVAYLCFENPDDIRMRLMIAARRFGLDVDEISDRLMVVDLRVKPEVIATALARAGGPFRLILVDTLAAFFDGDNVNDPVQGGEFMRRMRPWTRLPGLPAVIVAAHPVKNAGEEQLIPYGSGAILNEVDGNLTLWRRGEGGAVKFHWQGKLRGLEFEPAEFRFEVSTSPSVLDAKARLVRLPVMLPGIPVDAEARETADRNSAIGILRAMMAEPRATQRRWADMAGCSQGMVSKRLSKLRAEKLAEVNIGQWALTAKGKKVVEQWA